LRILTVVGNRPQFVKASVVSRALAELRETTTIGDVDEQIVHTGQHYDYSLSQIFFEQLDLKTPAWNLGIGSGSHAQQTGEILKRLEAVLQSERPDLVLVYGDTNSTLAGALAAIKLHIQVAHVEAGLRSGNMRMAEEVNRVLTDRISALLFCPTATAAFNLAREGITSGVHITGDVMYDCLKVIRRRDRCSRALAGFGLQPLEYAVATIHRAENTDNPIRLRAAIAALEKLVTMGLRVVFPVHPRTSRRLTESDISVRGLQIIEPVGYIEMVALTQHARLIVTDSGGLQKEAFLLDTPCVTLREETEWPETLSDGWNVLAGCDTRRIVESCARQLEKPIRGDGSAKDLFGDGLAAEEIARLLCGHPTADD